MARLAGRTAIVTGAGFHLERHGDERKSRPREHHPRAPVQSRSLHRDEHPQDLLGALVFLSSADSDFVTGQTMMVDGGNANT
jgi:NAD(P)-dependent dehydrogenase (short-subunit alcohol dehydrogenase family)